MPWLNKPKRAVMRPQRVQLASAKDATAKPNTVFVGSPSRWALPYRAGEYSQTAAVAMYRQDLVQMDSDKLAHFLAPLRHKDLGCQCRPDSPCHADVLLELANRP